MTTNSERLSELLGQITSGQLPPSTVNPCNECPWRRNATPGHLGPFTAASWVEAAHSDTPIMCHKTLRDVDHDFTDPEIRQCRGAAIFRANVHKMPRNPTAEVGPRDVVSVFDTGQEMVDHHEGHGPTMREASDAPAR